MTLFLVSLAIGAEVPGTSMPLAIPDFHRLDEEPEMSQLLAAMAAGCGLPASPLTGSAYALYDVVITGATDAESFERQGVLLVTQGVANATSADGPNPNELLLVSGAPMTSPEAGAIQYATNSALFPLVGGNECTTAAGLDLATVMADPAAGALQVTPTTSLSPAGALNGFNQTSGLLANVYNVAGGSLTIGLVDGGRGVVGEIALEGRGYIYPGGTTYTASFQGTLRGVGLF